MLCIAGTWFTVLCCVFHGNDVQSIYVFQGNDVQCGVFHGNDVQCVMCFLEMMYSVLCVSGK